MSMYWEEDPQDGDFTVPKDVIDLVFTIQCKHLPNEHAWALGQALLAELPWLRDEAGAGVHPIQISETGNGWMRPEHPDELLHLSRRTRLVLRIPDHRREEAEALLGKTLDVAGHPMTLLKAANRDLSTSTTLFSRHIVVETGDNEGDFIDRIASRLQGMGIRPRKMLPGKARRLRIPGGELQTCSLMLAKLSVAESVTLQQRGLGEHRHLGCGLFVAHKDIDEVSPEQVMR